MQFLRSSSGGCNTSSKNKLLRERGVDALSRVTKKTVSGSSASCSSSDDEDDERFMEKARRYNAPKHFMLKGMGEAADAVSCSTSSCESESVDDEHASSDDEEGDKGSSCSRTSNKSNGHDDEEEEEDESTTSSSGDEEDDEDSSTDSGEDSYEDEDDDDDEVEDEETSSEVSSERKKKQVASKTSKKKHNQQQHGRHLVAPRRKRLGGGSAHICSPTGTHEDGIPLMVQINTTEDSLCGESQTTLSTQLGSIDKSGSTLRRRSTAPSDVSRTRSEGRTSFIEPVDETCATSSRGNSLENSLQEGGQEPPFLDFSGRRPAETDGIPVGGTTPGGSLASSISASASALRSTADLSTTSPFKKYTTASGLPPSCQLRDAQFLKLNFPESHWAPDIRELEHLEALMNVQCTLICSYDPSIRESFWVCLMKVMKKRRANGISQICIGYVKQDLRCCDLPRGSQIVLLPKHIQKVDNKSSDILFQKLIAAEQKQKEMTRIRPVLPGGGPHLPGGP